MNFPPKFTQQFEIVKTEVIYAIFLKLINLFIQRPTCFQIDLEQTVFFDCLYRKHTHKQTCIFTYTHTLTLMGTFHIAKSETGDENTNVTYIIIRKH